VRVEAEGSIGRMLARIGKRTGKASADVQEPREGWMLVLVLDFVLMRVLMRVLVVLV
jgi:hypothetical protein